MNSRKFILFAATIVLLMSIAALGRLWVTTSHSLQQMKRGEEVCEAALRGDARTVRKLLSEGALPNYDTGGASLIEYAWQGRDKARMDEVLGAHPNLNIALFKAARRNDPEFAAFLLKHGADPNTKDDGGVPVVRINNDKVRQILLKSGARE